MRLPLPVPQIKKLLVDEGLIAPEKFDELFAEATRKNQSILDVLVSGGFATTDYLSNLISKTLGVPRVDFAVQKIQSDAVKLIPEDIARQRQVIVFKKEEDGTYDVAMVDPSDLETIAFLGQRLKGKIKPFLATNEDLNRGFSVYGYELGQDFKSSLKSNIQASLSSHVKERRRSRERAPDRRHRGQHPFVRRRFARLRHPHRDIGRRPVHPVPHRRHPL